MIAVSRDGAYGYEKKVSRVCVFEARPSYDSGSKAAEGQTSFICSNCTRQVTFVGFYHV